MQANTQKIRQVDVQGGFTAAAGHNFYTARAFPEEYWNRIAFVNEPTGHVVHRAIIERQGSGFAEKDGWNIAASDDEWFAPVHAEVGPDGALWLLDFYDFIIQHNPTPGGPIAQGYPVSERRGNAYDTPLREHDRGRIYRLVWKGAKPYTPLSLSASRPARARAGAPQRQHVLAHDGAAPARRARQDRRRPAAHRHRQRPHRRQDRPQLPRRPRAVDDARPGRARRQERRRARCRARARSRIRPPACARRRSRCCRRRAQSVAALLSAGALNDKDLNVRLNALLALSQMPASVEAGRAIYRASKEKEVIEDEWLPEAVWIAATRHQDGFLKAYADDVGLAEVMRVAVRGARGERGGGVDWSAPALADADWMSIPAPKIWSETAARRARRHDLVPPGDRPAGGRRRQAARDPPRHRRRHRRHLRQRRAHRRDGDVAQPAAAVHAFPRGVLVAGRNVIAVRISNVNGRGGFVPDPAPAPGVVAARRHRGPGADRHGHRRRRLHRSARGRVAGEDRGDVGGRRRREILPTVPIAQQFLLANSPVADMLKSPATAPGAAARHRRQPSPSASSSRWRGRRSHARCRDPLAR